MSIARRSDGRYVVKPKDSEGRWKQRSSRFEEEARQFDAECQYDSSENQREEIEELKQERAEALHRITEIDRDIRTAQKELGKR